MDRRLWIIFVYGFFPLTICGCSGDANAPYIPASNTARKALEISLKKWQSGDAHGPIETGKPAINVFDMRWQQGKKLESFEILEELAEAHRTFSVKIKLAKQPEEMNKYLVVGIDPLLVFRDIDYQHATGQ